MLFDKKKSVSVILSKMDRDGRTSEVAVSPESDAYNEYTAFAEDLLSGFRDGSVNKIASTLKAFHSMIEDKDQIQDKGE